MQNSNNEKKLQTYFPRTRAKYMCQLIFQVQQLHNSNSAHGAISWQNVTLCGKKLQITEMKPQENQNIKKIQAADVQKILSMCKEFLPKHVNNLQDAEYFVRLAKQKFEKQILFFGRSESGKTTWLNNVFPPNVEQVALRIQQYLVAKLYSIAYYYYQYENQIIKFDVEVESHFKVIAKSLDQSSFSSCNESVRYLFKHGILNNESKELRNVLQMNCNGAYWLLTQHDRILSSNYVPTLVDLQHAHIRTNASKDQKSYWNGHKYLWIDG